MRPSQQLGAAPGSNTLPGLEGFEPEGSIDGAEFASSGEAEAAPRAGADDFDEELTYETLDYIATADRMARERAMNYVGAMSMNYVVGAMNYGDEVTEREGPGNEEGAPTADASTVSCRPASSPRGGLLFYYPWI